MGEDMTPQETDELYMGLALQYAKFSKAKRKKVGACLVTSNGVVLGGFNGTPSGTDNNCEVLKPQYFPNPPALETKPEVIHAELNCILKGAKEGVSVKDSVMYISLSPCVPCASMLKQAGIKRVVYKEQYRDPSGIEYLLSNGILVQSYEDSIKTL
jgi:dCMP deaminase